MKPNPCRHGEDGGIFVLILVAVAIGAILIAGVWVVLKVISCVQRINPDHRDNAAIIISVPGNVQIAANTITIPNPNIPAPPLPIVLRVLESTNLETWTVSPLSVEQMLFNLNNRINLTNNSCFYRISYE